MFLLLTVLVVFIDKRNGEGRETGLHHLHSSPVISLWVITVERDINKTKCKGNPSVFHGLVLRGQRKTRHVTITDDVIIGYHLHLHMS